MRKTECRSCRVEKTNKTELLSLEFLRMSQRSPEMVMLVDAAEQKIER